MLKITPFKQTDDSRCGPACIKMVLNYYGIDVTEDEAAEACGWTYELGCTNKQTMDAIRSFGLDCALYYDCDFDALETFLYDGYPAIVDWFSPGISADVMDGRMNIGHYSIVGGLDEDAIYLIDPELGGVRTILRDEFMRVWFDWEEGETINCETLTLRQAIVVYPKTK